jgi:hypothetical protein
LDGEVAARARGEQQAGEQQDTGADPERAARAGDVTGPSDERVVAGDRADGGEERSEPDLHEQ